MYSLSLKSPLDDVGSELHAPRRFTLSKESRYPLYGGCNISPLPAFDPWTVQPLAFPQYISINSRKVLNARLRRHDLVRGLLPVVIGTH